MNKRKKFGFATAAAGLGLMVVGIVAPTTASAAVTANPTTFLNANADSCADIGLPTYTKASGQITSVVGATTGLLTYTVSNDREVTITAKDATVGDLWVVMKGGDNYNLYHPEVANMVSPLNGGGQVPAISHWYACYTIVDVTTTTEETTTTVEETTTTVEETTTTVEETTTTVEETTTTVEDTTTTSVDSEGPTTTIADTTTSVVDEETTTTIVDSEGPTTTAEQQSGGPTTTITSAAPGLPRTGASQSGLIALGLLMVLGGILFIALTRRPDEA